MSCRAIVPDFIPTFSDKIRKIKENAFLKFNGYTVTNGCRFLQSWYGILHLSNHEFGIVLQNPIFKHYDMFKHDWNMIIFMRRTLFNRNKLLLYATSKIFSIIMFSQ